MPAAIPAQALLLFRVGPIFCCAPTAPVATIAMPPSLTHPPGSNAAQPGIFKHGDQLVRARDLRQIFGIAMDHSRATVRVIIVQQPHGCLGFWVDEIIGIQSMPTHGIGPLPALLPTTIFNGTYPLDRHIYLSTDFELLAKLTGSGLLRAYLTHLVTPPLPMALTTESKPIPDLPSWTPLPSPTPSPSIAIPPSSTTATPVKVVAARVATTPTSAKPLRPTRPNNPTTSVTSLHIRIPVVTPPIPIAEPTQPKTAITPPAVTVTSSMWSWLLPVGLLMTLLAGLWWGLSYSTRNTSRLTSSLIVPTPVLPSTLVIESTPPPMNTVTPYQAEIRPDKSGITIVLRSPEGKSLNTTTAALGSNPALTNSPEQTGGTTIEIIHIVVKGDTLWAIATRYVNDPYRYPELAALSRIKNPDLIYPGNRVRIIQQ